MRIFNNPPKASTSGAVSRRFSTTELELAAGVRVSVTRAKSVDGSNSVYVFKVLLLVLVVGMGAVFFTIFSQTSDSSVAPAPVQVVVHTPTSISQGDCAKSCLGEGYTHIRCGEFLCSS